MAWMLGLILGCLWAAPAATAPSPPLCKSFITLRENLNFTNRRQHMKYNFPINYTIKVHHEEVFRISNITRLKAREDHLEDRDLQELWFFVNLEVLKKVLGILPQRHPSHTYTFELEALFRLVQQKFDQERSSRGEQAEREIPERIQKIMNKIKDPKAKAWKWVKPKALLDNCFRTMHCLFGDCFQDQEEKQDYCNHKYWKRGRKAPARSA